MKHPNVLVLVFSLPLLLAGCGNPTVPQQALLCQIDPVVGGYQVKCPGQAAVNLMNGRDGQAGVNGSNGQDGLPSLIAQLPAENACAAGGIIVVTSLDSNRNGSVDAEDANVQSSTLCNGTSAPISQFTPVAIVNPCGVAPGIQNEVFLRLQNGMLLASFSDDVGGTNTRFSILQPGTYMTTDGDHCLFTLTSAMQITNESHHY